jgi:hypothetical protein
MNGDNDFPDARRPLFAVIFDFSEFRHKGTSEKRLLSPEGDSKTTF